MKFEIRTRALIGLLVLGVTWGLSGSLSRTLQTEIHPLQQTALQCLISLVVMLCGAGSRSIFPRLSWRSVLILHARAIFGGLVGISLFLAAYRRIPIAHVAWIQSLPLPIFWSVAIYREQLAFRHLLCAGLGFLGVTFMIGFSAAGVSSVGQGELFALLGTALFSFGIVIGRSLIDELGVEGTIAWSFLLTAGYGIVAATWFEGRVINGPRRVAIWLPHVQHQDHRPGHGRLVPLHQRRMQNLDFVWRHGQVARRAEIVPGVRVQARLLRA